VPKVTAEHRAARRDQIIAAAARCVGREGFHKTTMADVIAEAGLSSGAVYGYFSSKTDIIKSIADLAIGPVVRHLQQLSERDPVPTPAVALRSTIEHLLSVADRPGVDLTRVGVQAWGEALRDPDVHAIVSTQMRQIRDAFENIVRRAQLSGNVPGDVDAAHAAQAMVGLLPGFMLQRLILGDVSAPGYLDGIRALRD
jgi:AcrR family transcriptional regulator